MKRGDDPSYEALKRRAETAEAALKALREGQVDAILGEERNLVVRLADVEAALVESEELFRTVFQQAAVGMAQLLPEGRYVRVNPRLAEILGYDPRELEGRFFREITHPDDLGLQDAKLAEISAGKSDTFEIEKRFFHRSGSVVWARLYSRAVRHPDGAVKYLITSIVDITERRRTEEALRRRERQLQQIFEILPIGLWFVDRDGTLLRGNPAGVRIWGAEPKVPMSEYGVFKAWRLPERQPVEAGDWALARTIRDGATIVDELLEIEAFDGRKKTILNYTAPILDAEGRVDGAIVANLDISDRMALERQLRQAQKMEAVGRLAGGVAHDFNNMLGVILGYAELARQKVGPDDALAEDLEQIMTAARRSADITRQLLAFARRQTVAPRVLDLNDTVEGMLRMLRRLIGEDIELRWLPGAGLWPVRIDPTQVDQILANLLVNARDAIDGVGQVSLETHNARLDAAWRSDHPDFSPGEYVLLAVSDTGRGMDSETLENLFEPFFTTKELGRGTGLGLATVYGIVRQNGGLIDVSSQPSHGTTFRIYLPRHRGRIEGTPGPQKGQVPTGRGETVLLVEDDGALLKLARRMLEGLDYRVLAAGGPNEALDLVGSRSEEIHLLITDVVMPEISGRDLAERLKALSPGLRVLFMSGYTADVIARRGVLDADVHFVQKPFSRDELALKVAEVLK